MRPAATQLWSGTQVDFYSRAFADHALPLFVLSDTLVPAARVDDTTFTISLPAVRGQITIDVQFWHPGDTVTVGPLTLYGFRDAHLGPALKGAPHVWPGGGVASVIAAGEVGLVRYDLTHNLIAQRWPDSLHASECNFGPGMSFRPDHFVLQGPGCARLKSWRLTGEPVVADSATPGLSDGWTLVEMSPGLWLDGRDDKFYLIQCADGVCTRRQEFGYTTDGAVLSPRGDRVALCGFHALVAGGPWVLDAATGEKAFSIPALSETYAATFSPDGDTIFMVGRAARHDPTAPPALVMVVAVDATAGRILDSTSIAEPDTRGWPSAIGTDPLTDALYVAGYTLGLVPTLLVYRRSTFELRAVLGAPASNLLGVGGELSIIPAPLDGTVYLLLTPRIYDPPSAPITVYRFDRMP